jgi:signal transduction histidine kinase
VARVLRTGQSELIRGIPEAMLAEIAPDPETLRLLRQVGLASLLSVPLTARGQLLGVLTLALAEGDERYDLRDLAFAEELARRAATALDNARLYHRAQTAIREREEILGVVSHDLRNPLNVIALSAELLLETELPEEKRRRQFEVIRRSARGMNRLIQDLLDVSCMEAGRLSVDPQPECVEDIVADACELMRPLAEERLQRLAAAVAPGLPPVSADRARVQQVLSNLVGNALKFTGEGGSVHVRTEALEDGVRISVDDTGPGIPPEHLGRIFDRHWQATGTAHLGAGLGLAIARGIVEAHGGRIWAESEVGRGTSVHFVLPAADAVRASRPARTEAAAPEEAQAALGTPRV